MHQVNAPSTITGKKKELKIEMSWNDYLGTIYLFIYLLKGGMLQPLEKNLPFLSKCRE